MNPSLIRLDDESPFTSPTPVGQPLGEPVALTRTAAHRPLADGNGVTGIWECTPGRFRRQVEQAEYSYIVSGEGR
ncbi:TPA: cupin domain-containing protein, partial [Pseudomonas aeruginosa]